MKRAVGILGVAAFVALTNLAVSPAAASHPDILRDYRFIPSRSTLQVTGGFAGLEQTLHAFGKFGLVTGYEEGYSCMAIGCPPPPTHVPFADFVDVRAWLVPDGPLTYVWDLDDTLNLTGLNGTFSSTSPNRLHFRGFDGQGAPLRLDATIVGRLIHLVGVNDPPCCDFFNYRFDAYAHLAPFADFNFDGIVDSADYTSWRDHVGMAGSATLDDGDADGDGDVDHADFDVWKLQVGTTTDMAALAETDGLSGATAGSSSSVSAPVPEPASLAMGLVALAALAGPRRRFPPKRVPKRGQNYF